MSFTSDKYDEVLSVVSVKELSKKVFQKATAKYRKLNDEYKQIMDSLY